jgi:DNA-binding CsgD family transcriptional regulator
MNQADGLAVAIDVGRVATAPGQPEQRAAAIVEPLRRVVPFVAAWIGLLDPGRNRYRALVSEGYAAPIENLFGSTRTVVELERLGMHRTGRVVRAQDVPGPLPDRPIWADYLLPAGFREGLSVGLFTSDGRHVGILTLNTDTDAHPTRAACDMIETVAPMIGDAIDPMRDAASAAQLVADAAAGAVLTVIGSPLPLPGLPDHPLLAAGSPLLISAAVRLRGPGAYATFLCPSPLRRPAGYVRVTVLGCQSPAIPDVCGVVLLSPYREATSLTPRELEVLGLLVDGCTNEAIAATLAIAGRTVAAHVEHILLKLAVPSRTAAAVRALRLGTYVPKELTEAAEHQRNRHSRATKSGRTGMMDRRGVLRTP